MDKESEVPPSSKLEKKLTLNLKQQCNTSIDDKVIEMRIKQVVGHLTKESISPVHRLTNFQNGTIQQSSNPNFEQTIIGINLKKVVDFSPEGSKLKTKDVDPEEGKVASSEQRRKSVDNGIDKVLQLTTSKKESRLGTQSGKYSSAHRGDNISRKTS